MKKIMLVILSAFALLAPCVSTSSVGEANAGQGASASSGTASAQTPSAQTASSSARAASSSKAEDEQDATLYKGAGLTIAVTSPQLIDAGQNAAYVPQYFQDSLTGNFARYSKMTVLDRRNESLALAEQELSESGYYSEDGAAQIGRMTNAQLVVVGNIQRIGNTYEINFRANDPATNEIKASANGRYALSELESGTAVNETTESLLDGLGIELSEREKAALSSVNKTENDGTLNLAKGASAEKSEDYIAALVAYSQVGGTLQSEAAANVHTMLAGSFDVSNIQARVAFYDAQTEKWNKIFAQLESYMNENVAYLVYDFSSVTDKIDMRTRTVDLAVTPGVKLVPNRTAMNVWATVLNEWMSILNDRNNDVWTQVVSKPIFGAYNGGRTGAARWVAYNIRYTFAVAVGLFDDEGNLIKRYDVNLEMSERPYNSDRSALSEVVVKSQRRYFDEMKFSAVYFNGIDMSDIAGGVNVRIIDAQTQVFDVQQRVYKKPLGIVSVSDWAQ